MTSKHLDKFLKPWSVWKGPWRKRERMSGRYLQFWMLIMSILFLAIPYYLTNQLANWMDVSRLNPSTSLDDAIPFIAWTFIPYATLYLYYPAAILLSPRDDTGRKQLLILHQVLFAVAWVIYAIFIFLPTRIHIREQVPSALRDGEGFWGFFYGDLMFNIDTPWNAWPSLHIVQSLILLLSIQYWMNKRGEYSGLMKIAWVCWLALAISITTTKQHFVFDLWTGLLVALLSWFYLIKPAFIWAEGDEAENHCVEWDDTSELQASG